MEAGESFALVTVVAAEGSSPGKPGHKMIVYADGRQEGTAGGGKLEHRVKQEALEMIRRGEGGLLSYSFDPDAPDSFGMLCGGSAQVAVEVVVPKNRVLLCGGGHVAQALARQLRELGIIYGVVDKRQEVATAACFPDAAEIVHERPPDFIERAGLARYTHVIVMTHDHALDRETVRAVAGAGFTGYVGLIGSRRKWDVIREALQEAQVAPAWIEDVHCPIGLSIGAHTPAEIAISIAAQIVQESNVPK
jgi:xanthine dehydrogenase accessory factor